MSTKPEEVFGLPLMASWESEVDWRKHPDEDEKYEDALDNDDDVPTPESTKAMLGFDPAEWKDNEE